MFLLSLAKTVQMSIKTAMFPTAMLMASAGDRNDFGRQKGRGGEKEVEGGRGEAQGGRVLIVSTLITSVAKAYKRGHGCKHPQ